MNKKIFLAIFLAAFMVCQTACQSSPAHIAPAPLAHNPNLPYKVWVICLDLSLSLQAEQYRRLQVWAEQLVSRDVGPNDLVFLIPIRSGFESTLPFQMPAGSTLSAKKPAAAQALLEAKTEVIATIHGMKQNSGATDLKSTLEVAFDLMRQYPKATRRILIVGSDFLNDSGLISPTPPAPRGGAAGVETLLLVTYPKPKYLQRARLTASGLLENVETNWAAYFRNSGVQSVSVRLVDAAYAGVEGIKTQDQVRRVGSGQ